MGLHNKYTVYGMVSDMVDIILINMYLMISQHESLEALKDRSNGENTRS